ncbi:hypothetical protein [Pseudaminobacter salicylatoxidans]|uniref:hypothetical protein n=1 Tax=Pseudaminobacter salicylatoxidans TaxID=93369 RepID=UPI00047456C6
MRVDTSGDIAIGGDAVSVDGPRDLIEVLADRAHALGKQAEDSVIPFPKKGLHPGALHRERPHEAETVMPAAFAATSSAPNSDGEKRT